MSLALLIAGSPIINFPALQNLIQIILQAHPTVKIIAIDSGLEICHQMRLEVFKIIGDFDSVDSAILEKYPDALKVDFPSEKDESDTELALNFAIQAGFDEILLVNAAGGRMDHFLFNALLLFHHQATIKLFDATGTLLALPLGDTNFNLPNGTIFSLIPLEECTGVSVSGAKYPFQDAKLLLNSRTLSNISQDSVVGVQIRRGNLLFYADTWIM